MVRRSALLEAGGFEQPPYLPLVDYPTWMKLALKGRFLFIPEVLGYWRRHPLSITMNKNEQIFKGFMKYCDEFVISFSEELTELGLEEFVKNRGAIAYLSLAWIRLSNRDWEDALKLSKKSWSRNEVLSWSFRVKIIISFISAYLHMDIPSFLRKMREFFYKEKISRQRMLRPY